MRTLIIYASKHGSTEKCVRLLKDGLQGEVIVSEVKKSSSQNLDSFDKIVIGGSIHIGKIQKEITEFCEKNLNKLISKRTGIFICCMNRDDEYKQLETSFPMALLNTALAKDSFGGEFNFEKMNMFEKLAIKMVSKSQGSPITDTKKNISMLSKERINSFIQSMNAA